MKLQKLTVGNSIRLEGKHGVIIIEPTEKYTAVSIIPDTQKQVRQTEPIHCVAIDTVRIIMETRE